MKVSEAREALNLHLYLDRIDRTVEAIARAEGDGAILILGSYQLLSEAILFEKEAVLKLLKERRQQIADHLAKVGMELG